ncbi:hypothetical protein B0H19DRAFT_1071582 [Mycena capillaripes]|nr:hypothetical protein B0H19DRAFT_1071582 [Mycena capillaripes]
MNRASRAPCASLLSPLAVVPSSLPNNRMSVAHVRPAPQRRDFNGTFVAGSGYCPSQLEGTPPTGISISSIQSPSIPSPSSQSSQEPSSIQSFAPTQAFSPSQSFAPSQLFAPSQSFAPTQSFVPTQSTTPQSAAQNLIPPESTALSSTTETPVPMPRKQMASGTIAGIVLGILLTVTIMMLVTFLVRKHRHRGRTQDTLKPEGHPYLNPFCEALSSSQVVTCSDVLSAGLDTPVTTEARRHEAPAARKDAVPQPSAPYHEENSSMRRQNDDLQARVRTLEMQLQSPWAGDFLEEPPGYLE